MTRKEIRANALANLLDASTSINAALDWIHSLREKGKEESDLYAAKGCIWRAYWAIEKKGGK